MGSQRGILPLMPRKRPRLGAPLEAPKVGNVINLTQDDHWTASAQHSVLSSHVGRRIVLGMTLPGLPKPRRLFLQVGRVLVSQALHHPHSRNFLFRPADLMLGPGKARLAWLARLAGKAGPSLAAGHVADPWTPAKLCLVPVHWALDCSIQASQPEGGGIKQDC